MPGWKKNIPICLQAEEQERGELGGRVGRPRCLPVPQLLKTCPRAGKGGATSTRRGSAPDQVAPCEF